MEDSPSSTEQEVRTTTPLGNVDAPVESPASSAETPSEAEKSNPVAASTPNEQVTISNDSEEPEEFEYEFSHQWEGRLYFVHLWDTNDRSALERVCGEPVPYPNTIRYSDTGNGFYNDSYGFHWAFKKQPYKRSFVVADCTPLPQETHERRRTTNKPSADDILSTL